MKSKLYRLAIIVVVSLTCTSRVYSQAGFQDLGFESAMIVPVSGDLYGRVEFTPAFPGWIGYVGTNVQTLAQYNNIFLDSSGIAIFDTNSFFEPIEGNFTAVLAAGLALGTSQPADTTLSQTGFIPAGMQSLLFDALLEGDVGSFAVTINGQMLSLTPLSITPTHTLYGANISAWSDQTATLAFTVFAEQPHVNNNYLYLDSIQFSPSPVPEPAFLSLFALCGLFLSIRRWRN